MENAPIVIHPQEEKALQVKSELDPSQMVAQVERIQAMMGSLMHDNTHYGTIPGTNKPTLYKAGAEKLQLMFRLVAEYDTVREELNDGHREYEVTCRMIHQVTGALMGTGVGLCSTMESKYRYRKAGGSDYEVLDVEIPKDAKEKKVKYRKQGLGMQMVNGQWAWVKYAAGGGRGENPDLADTYNTVLKMAKKRALVDAVLSCTAASDIFTQDMEDIQANKQANDGGQPQPSQQQRYTQKRDLGAPAPKFPESVQTKADNPAAGDMDQPQSEFGRIHPPELSGELQGEIDKQSKKPYGILKIAYDGLANGFSNLPADDGALQRVYDENGQKWGNEANEDEIRLLGVMYKEFWSAAAEVVG